MRIHLYKKKQCLATYLDIDLTDDIRENILTYGTYQEEKINNNIIENGYIYIILTRACKNGNEKIYKIGKSKDYEKRLKGYTKGSEFKLVIKVKDYHNCEKLVIKECVEKYIQRTDYGIEYFECNLLNLYHTIINQSKLIEIIIRSEELSSNKKIPYTCIKCGFETDRKSTMYNHLMKKIKSCPASMNKIDLTDEIKEYILENRVYHIPKEIKQIDVVQTIKKQKKINTFITKLDPVDKLSKFLEYKDTKLFSLEDDVKSYFYDKIESMISDDYVVSERFFYDTIKEITMISNIEEMNIIYNEKSKEINIYNNGEWYTGLIDMGIINIIKILKDNYLDHYEYFLFRQIYLHEFDNKEEYEEYLKDYYKLLITFNFKPVVDGNDILGDLYYDLENKWLKIYDDIACKLKRSEINKIKKEVSLIVKNYSIKNLNELNKEITNTLMTDATLCKILDCDIN
jgi:hypothetical protein